MTSEEKRRLGEFPYPLTEGPRESRYLTWLRNHSNYMTPRGFFDLLRSVGVLVRGIVVNFLIFLPYLLLISIVLGYTHHWMLVNPYRLTWWVMRLAIIWVLLFPVTMPLYKIWSYRRSLETGSESSLNKRNGYERSFGGFLFIILLTALLETLPWGLEFLHHVIHREEFDWTSMFASLIAALGLLSASGNILSSLRGATKKVAAVVIGVLGFLVPVLVILLATEYLVYGLPPGPWMRLSPLIVPVIGVVGILIGMGLGIWRKAFRRKEIIALAVILLFGVLLSWGVFVGGTSTERKGDTAIEELQEIIDPLQRVSAELSQIPDDVELDPEVADLVNEMVIAHRDYQMMNADLVTERRHLKDLSENLFNLQQSKADSSLWQRLNWGYETWRIKNEKSRLLGSYFASGQEFVTLGNRLSDLPRGSIEPLRRQVTALAYQELLENLHNEDTALEREDAKVKMKAERAKKAEERAEERAKEREALDKEKGRAGFLTKMVDRMAETKDVRDDAHATIALIGNEMKVATALRVKLLELQCAQMIKKPDGTQLGEGVLKKWKVGSDSKSWRVDALALKTAAIERAQIALVKKAVTENAFLADRELLEELVGETIKEPMPGKAKVAMLGGKEELIKLVDNRRLVGQLFLSKNISIGARAVAQAKAAGKTSVANLEEARKEAQTKEEHANTAENVALRMERQATIAKEKKTEAQDEWQKLETLGDVSQAQKRQEAETLANKLDEAADAVAKDAESARVKANTAKADYERAKYYVAMFDKAGAELVAIERAITELLVRSKLPGSYDQPSLADARALSRIFHPQEPVAKAAGTSEGSTVKVRANEVVAEATSTDQRDEGKLAGADLLVRSARLKLAHMALAKFSVEQLAAAYSYLSKSPAERSALVNPAVSLQWKHDDTVALAHGNLEALITRAFEAKAPAPVELAGSGDGVVKVENFSRADINKLLLAEKIYNDIGFGENAAQKGKRDTSAVMALVRGLLVDRALQLGHEQDAMASLEEARRARRVLGSYSKVQEGELDHDFAVDELAMLCVRRLINPDTDSSDQLISTLMFGDYGPLNQAGLGGVKAKLTSAVINPKAILLGLLAVVLLLGTSFTVDVNLTSVHGLYRDRLASAYLVGENTDGDVGIEEDIDLQDICCYEARSTAPYHLVNVALNLQGSKDVGIRDRNSDFFIFSKRFIGSGRTGYCRTEAMEDVFPQMSLATAMAVSAAAASPNSGRYTSRLRVAFMTLLNVRLGYWVPNPGILEQRRIGKLTSSEEGEPPPLGFNFDEVFAQEMREIEQRWEQIDPSGNLRWLAGRKPFEKSQKDFNELKPCVEHGLAGIAFSGGGIRSATFNLGLVQTLHSLGLVDHFDYMSTVSGGGYLGSSISTLMRSRTILRSEISGTVRIKRERIDSPISGTVERITETDGLLMVRIKGDEESDGSILQQFSADSIFAIEQLEALRRIEVDAKRKAAVRDAKVPVQKGEALIRCRNPEEIKDEGEGNNGEVGRYGNYVVTVSSGGVKRKKRTYRFSRHAKLNVSDKESIRAGTLLLAPRSKPGVSQISGSVSIDGEEDDDAPTVAAVWSTKGESENRERKLDNTCRVQVQAGSNEDDVDVHDFSIFEHLLVETGSQVEAGDDLVEPQNTLSKRFGWRVRPLAFLREMACMLDEEHRWVNLSDGGHLENLAAIELLRRRCKFIIVGDGEADPNHQFNGLATLMRTARIDLGVEIVINLDPMRLEGDAERGGLCSSRHWALGKIQYPGDEVEGYLLYLKSSFTGDEGEVIQEYRRRNPSFPHQSTADQMFDEGQFEAYRALGQHVAETVAEQWKELHLDSVDSAGAKKALPPMSYEEFQRWLRRLEEFTPEQEATEKIAKATKESAKRNTTRKTTPAKKTARKKTATKKVAKKRGKRSAKKDS